MKRTGWHGVLAKRIFSSVLLAAVSWAGTARAEAPWPMRQQNAQQTGQSPYAGPRAPRLLWWQPVNAPSGGTAVGADGTVYAGGIDFAWGIKPGDLNNPYYYFGGSLVGTAPAIAPDGTVCFAGLGTLGFEPNLAFRWGEPSVECQNGSAIAGPDGTFYVGNTTYSGSTCVAALRPSDGGTQWTFTPSAPVCGGPALSPDGSTLYVATASSLYALDAAGNTLWEQPVANAACSIPMVGSDGTVFVTSTAGVEKFNAGGSSAGTIAMPAGKSAAAFALDVTGDRLIAVVFASAGFPSPTPSGGAVTAIDLSDGHVLWMQAIAGGTYTAPYAPSRVFFSHPIVDRDGYVYLATTVGDASMMGHTFYLYGFDPAGGRLFDQTIPATGMWSDPRLLSLDASGTLYFLAYERINAFGEGKATPLIFWGNPADIAYGTALSATQLNATANVPGTFAYNPAGGTVLNAGSGQTLSATFTPTDSANYNGASKSVTINVAKATPTLTWANPADIVYGTALGAAQLNATANVAGSFTYNPAAGTVLGAGSRTLSATFTPTDSANYAGASKSVTINVAKATPTITWATPAGITYGTALSSTQLNATANAPGNFVYTPAAGAVLTPGTQTLSAAFTPSDAANYNSASKSVSLVVTSNFAITTPSPLPPGYVSAPYSLTFAASGGVGSYTWSRTAGTLPPGLSLSAAGVLSGTPTTTGPYSFTVQAKDVNNVTATKSFSLTLNAARPDLTPTAVSGPASGRKGKTISVSSTVKNQGQARAGSFTVRFYLSTDANISATDDILLGSKTVSSLNAGSSTTVSGNMTIPSSTATRTYYIGVIADAAGTVAETDETNNSRAGNTISVTQ